MIIVNDSHSYFIRHHTLYVWENFKLLFYCKQILQNGQFSHCSSSKLEHIICIDMKLINIMTYVIYKIL